MTGVVIATEDALSEVVAETLLYQAGRCDIRARVGKKGFGYLKKRVADLDRLAENGVPVLLLTDLDRRRCPLEMIAGWLPRPRSARLLFRVAVRETESWVLADRAAFARFVGIPAVAVPTAPDELSDPKAAVLRLVRQSSKRELRRDILPQKGASSPVGLGYNSQLCHFVRSAWSSNRAVKHSPSLSRAVRRVRELLP
ncbi:MAG: DUF4276 family protein [Candidatus Thiosymbion ectosymbiont of Robbea hypermnestra]|nr:DUF4276 family protein [Candidatus Thiosymbion ectosymbiont of Robbea hypermnestra]